MNPAVQQPSENVENTTPPEDASQPSVVDNTTVPTNESSSTQNTETPSSLETVEPPSNANSSSSDSFSQRLEGFLFELEECKRTGIDVECVISITNEEEDRDLWVYNESRIIAEGKEYYPTELNERGGQLKLKLVNNVPLDVFMVFKEIPEEINQIDLVEAVCYLKDRFGPQFRGIPIVQ